MIDVLLTHSYHLAHDAKQWRKMQPYPPLGTLYAATAVRAAGHSVAVFDPMFAEPVAGFLEALDREQPKIVVIYEDDFNFVTKMCLTHMRELAGRFSGLARDRGLAVVVHGSDASDHPETYLARGASYVVKGEAEHAVADLCGALLRGEEPGGIAGLVYLSSADRRVLNSAPATNNLRWADLPVVARELIDFDRYRDAWAGRHGFFSTNVVASRGCPYRCNWCAKPISGNRFQQRSPKVVAAEMRELKTEFGVQHVWFGDDVFALDRRWVEAFAAEVEACGEALPFKIQSRTDLMCDATVAALKRAGCTEVWMGVESGSQKILDAMTKGLSLEAVHAARQRLRGAGIRACYFLQFGYPGEGWPEILETIRLVRETRPDAIGVSLSYPLPGTVFYERTLQQLGSKRNWTESGDLCAIHTAAYTDEFYHALRDALHAEVGAAYVGSDGQVGQGPLWDRVYALEQGSRNPRVASVQTDRPMTRASFLPVANLFAGAR